MKNRFFCVLFIIILFLLLIVSLVTKSFLLGFTLFVFLSLFFIMLDSDKIVYVFCKMTNKKELLTNIKENINFYRDIIQNYSVAELAFIVDFDIEYPRDVIAVLLKLQINGVIDIKNDQIIINNYQNNYELKKSEKYILDSIKNGKVVFPNDFFFTEIVRDELFNDDLLKYRKVNVGKFILFAILLVGFFLGLMPFIAPLFNIESEWFGYLVLLIFLIVFLCVSIVIGYLNNSGKDSYKLTKHGSDIYVKLAGLKKYLLEFTVINKRKIEEVFIWEDYLIYSIIFGSNREEIKKYSSLVIISE